MFRKLLGSAVVIGVVVLTGGMAVAGGWAATEFDEPLPGFTAGEEYLMGFTVLQHGVTPRWTDSVHLTFTAPGGEVIVKFPAEPVGEVGHFEAVVLLPTSGVWEFEVDQGVLTDYGLHLAPFVVGAVEVSAASGAAKLSPVPPTEGPIEPTKASIDVPSGALPASAASGLSVGMGLAMTVSAFAAGILITWLASSPGTGRREKVYKKIQPSPEAAWTTEN